MDRETDICAQDIEKVANLCKIGFCHIGVTEDSGFLECDTQCGDTHHTVCGTQFFYGMFTVHFHTIDNNNIQQMHFNMLIGYTNTPTCFGPSGPSSGSYTL